MTQLPKFEMQTIGFIRSCFKEKFGIPRQSGLATEAVATIEICPPYNREEAFRGLEDVSHLWISFVFHESINDHWKPMVRPPRLGGNKRLGVFATRSPNRPNPIGLSVVRLESVSAQNGLVCLEIRGGDFLDGTPVLDIKPYVAYADSIADALSGLAPRPPENKLRVLFSVNAEEQLSQREDSAGLDLRLLVEQLLQTDPRPAYKAGSEEDRLFGMRLMDFDLKWRVVGEEVVVESLEKTRAQL